jgi:COP9 signalosome complex subunit 7
VISAIYAGLIKAQLNPKDSLVQINSVAPLRDVAPTAISGLLSSLQAWAGRCDATLESLSCQMTQLRADADRRAARATARTEETRKLVESEQKGGMAPSPSSSYIPAGAAADGGIPFAANGPATTLRSNITSTGTASNHHHHQGGSTTKTNMMNSMLTVGGGNSFPTPTSGGSSASVPGASTASSLQVKPAVKRGSGQMGGPTGTNFDEEGVMDMDHDEDDPEGKKRASRRKLGD